MLLIFVQNFQEQQIISKITSSLEADPNVCFFLEGWSQGAQATVEALPHLLGKEFDAVKGIFLVGNPEHQPNLACNVDSTGGVSTRGVGGYVAAFTKGIPHKWVSKTLDVCALGDGVCEAPNGFSYNPITPKHYTYATDQNVQNQGIRFGVTVLKDGVYKGY